MAVLTIFHWTWFPSVRTSELLLYIYSADGMTVKQKISYHTALQQHLCSFLICNLFLSKKQFCSGDYVSHITAVNSYQFISSTSKFSYYTNVISRSVHKPKYKFTINKHKNCPTVYNHRIELQGHGSFKLIIGSQLPHFDLNGR